MSKNILHTQGSIVNIIRLLPLTAAHQASMHFFSTVYFLCHVNISSFVATFVLMLLEEIMGVEGLDCSGPDCDQSLPTLFCSWPAANCTAEVREQGLFPCFFLPFGGKQWSHYHQEESDHSAVCKQHLVRTAHCAYGLCLPGFLSKWRSRDLNT